MQPKTRKLDENKNAAFGCNYHTSLVMKRWENSLRDDLRKSIHSRLDLGPEAFLISEDEDNYMKFLRSLRSCGRNPVSVTFLPERGRMMALGFAYHTLT